MLLQGKLITREYCWFSCMVKLPKKNKRRLKNQRRKQNIWVKMQSLKQSLQMLLYAGVKMQSLKQSLQMCTLCRTSRIKLFCTRILENSVDLK